MLSNATSCLQSSLMWCSGIDVENALRGWKIERDRGRDGRILTLNELRETYYFLGSRLHRTWGRRSWIETQLPVSSGNRFWRRVGLYRTLRYYFKPETGVRVKTLLKSAMGANANRDWHNSLYTDRRIVYRPYRYFCLLHSSRLSLPSELRAVSSLASFRGKLKHTLFSDRFIKLLILVGYNKYRELCRTVVPFPCKARRTIEIPSAVPPTVEQCRIKTLEALVHSEKWGPLYSSYGGYGGALWAPSAGPGAEPKFSAVWFKQ